MQQRPSYCSHDDIMLRITQIFGRNINNCLDVMSSIIKKLNNKPQKKLLNGETPQEVLLQHPEYIKKLLQYFNNNVEALQNFIKQSDDTAIWEILCGINNLNENTGQPDIYVSYAWISSITAQDLCRLIQYFDNWDNLSIFMFHINTEKKQILLDNSEDFLKLIQPKNPKKRFNNLMIDALMRYGIPFWSELHGGNARCEDFDKALHEYADGLNRFFEEHSIVGNWQAE
jgi:hypothetical protein